MQTIILKAFATLIVLFSLTACSGGQSVRELSLLTAANTSLVATEMDDFIKGSKRTALRRTEAIAKLAQAVEDDKAAFQTFMEVADATHKMAGEDKKLNYAKVIRELQRISIVVAERRQASKGRQAALEAEIKVSQEKITAPKDDFKAIIKGLGSLGKKKKLKARIKFYGQYYKKVKEDIEAAKVQAAMAAEATGNAAAAGVEVAANSAKD